MKDATKKADFNVTVDAIGVDRFAFPKRDEMFECELTLTVNGKQVKVKLVLCKLVVIGGKVYTCLAILSNNVPGVYVAVRDHVLKCLGKADCVGIWFGDVNNTLSRARVSFRGMSKSNVKKVFNDHTQGTAWTRTVCVLLEGKVNVPRLLAANKPGEIKPVDHSSAMSFADYRAADKTPPKPGTRISLS